MNPEKYFQEMGLKNIKRGALGVSPKHLGYLAVFSDNLERKQFYLGRGWVIVDFTITIQTTFDELQCVRPFFLQPDMVVVLSGPGIKNPGAYTFIGLEMNPAGLMVFKFTNTTLFSITLLPEQLKDTEIEYLQF